MGRTLLILSIVFVLSAFQAMNQEVNPGTGSPAGVNSGFIPDTLKSFPDSLPDSISEEVEQDLLTRLAEAFEYYQRMNDPEKAFHYGEKLIRFKDSISGRQLKRKLASLEKEYKMEQKEREIQLLNNQRTTYQLRINATRQRQWVIMGGMGGLLAFVLALWHRVRTMRKTRDLLKVKAAQLQHEKNRAEINEQFKEQFLANVSHEIRTPMNAIMGITNILIKNQHLPNQAKYLTAMHESAKNLLVLINDILDLSKLEAGKVELVKAPFIVGEIISELQAKFKEKALSKGLAFHVEVHRDVPLTLNGDGFALSNILITLAGNGISFTERGQVDVVLSAGKQEGEEVTLKIMVRDTGIGIVPEKQEKILDTFVKVYEKSSIQYRGSGLELPIIKQLVSLQRGTIRVESEPGKGTTFFIEIPYHVHHEGFLPEVAQVRADECELRDIRVLLVEDNEFNVMVASSELESAVEGLKLDVAENGQVALEKLAQNPYHLIIMDLQMPVMDGYETTRNIRKMKGSKGRIPIIAMTANVLPQEIEKCLNEGMDDYISKPFDTKELLGKMKNLLRPNR